MMIIFRKRRKKQAETQRLQEIFEQYRALTTMATLWKIQNSAEEQRVKNAKIFNGVKRYLLSFDREHLVSSDNSVIQEASDTLLVIWKLNERQVGSGRVDVGIYKEKVLRLVRQFSNDFDKAQIEKACAQGRQDLGKEKRQELEQWLAENIG